METNLNVVFQKTAICLVDNGNVQFKIGDSTQIIQIPKGLPAGLPMKQSVKKTGSFVN